MFIKKIILSVGLLFMVQVCVAGSITCFSNTSGNWSDSTMWDACDDQVPGLLDIVVINHVVTLDTDTAELGGINVQIGGHLNVAQRLVNPELGYTINLNENATQTIDLRQSLTNLSAHLTINANGHIIVLGRVVGQFDIRINNTGRTLLNGKIGDTGSNSPTAFITDPGGILVFNIPNGDFDTPNFRVDGDMIFNDDILLSKVASITGSHVIDGETTSVIFNGTIDSINPSKFISLYFKGLHDSTLQFNQNIGETSHLGSLEMGTSFGANVEFNFSKMNARDFIQLPSPISLDSPTGIVQIENTSVDHTLIFFSDTIRTAATAANPNQLIINSVLSDIYFLGSIGDNNQPLSSLNITTPAPGGIYLNGGSVTTTVVQKYTGDVAFGNDTVLNSDQVVFQNNVDTGGFDLTLNTTDTIGLTKIVGVLSGSGDLIKNGTGFLDFHSINTLTGNILLNEGLLYNRFASNTIFPNVPQLSLAADTAAVLGHRDSGDYVISNNQSVIGNGLFSGVLITNSGAIVAPGLSSSLNTGLSTGGLTMERINMDTDSILSIEINGTAVNTEYDRLVLNQGGSLDNDSLGGAILDISFGFIPSIGNSFKIIASNFPITGTFIGLAEGAQIDIDGIVLSISYAAGAGNDVELTVVDVPPTIIYVNVSVAANGDGMGWETAFDNLQDALLVAIQNTEIWVAQGVYYPIVVTNPVQEADRLVTFTLIDDASVYGGFDGTETQLNQRDPELNTTILSGDISQDDINSDGNNILEDRLDIRGSNSSTIVNGFNVDTATVFSGFIVTAGQADGLAGSGVKYLGAGMYCGFGSEGPSIRESTFIGNYGSNGGGTYGCSQNVRDSNFINNSGNAGGAIISNGGYYENVLFQGNIGGIGGAMKNNSSLLTIVNSKFISNLSTRNFDRGGALFSGVNINLENVLFSGNKAEGLGGALALEGAMVANLINVTMTGNLAADEGGAISMTSSDTLNLRNSIIWNNHDSTTDTTATSSIDVNGGTYTQTHSLVQNFSAGTNGNLNTDPFFITDASPTTAPNNLGDTHLMDISLAINAGDNSFVTTGTDLDGRNRIFNGVVDIGAYENYPEQVFKDGFE